MRGGHLVRRFFGSLRPGAPAAADDGWATALLLPGEVDLWRRMSNPDRRHAIVVARRVQVRLGHEATRPVLSAALLHDVGKTASGLRTFGRVVATMSKAVVGPGYATVWSNGSGITRRVGLYIRHPELGGDLLAMAGSDPLTERWTREHHLPVDDWTLDPEVAAVLKAADDD